MVKAFKASVCQLLVGENKDDNLQSARRLITQAAVEGAKLVVLPEMFNCPYVASLFPDYAESYPGGETFQMLSETAREQAITLVGGSLPERVGSQIYNSSFVFGPDGTLLGRHRKIHLFDVILPGVHVKESSTLGYGDSITVLDTEFGRIGVAICYDIRFPELIRLMTLAGAQVVVIPAAFNMTTGPAHWEMIFRSRAVDNQIYLMAASPARNESAPYVSYGHSMIVDPWGDIVVRAGTGEQIISGEIIPERVRKIRSELPLLKHRRTDLYVLKENKK